MPSGCLGWLPLSTLLCGASHPCWYDYSDYFCFFSLCDVILTSIFLFAPMGLGSRRPRRLEKTQKSTFVPRHVLLFLERCTSSKKPSPNQAKAYFISYNHKNLRNCNFFGFGFFSLAAPRVFCGTGSNAKRRKRPRVQ